MKYPVLECEYCGNLYYEVQAECGGCGSRRLRQKEYLRDKGIREGWFIPSLPTISSAVLESTRRDYSPSDAALIIRTSKNSAFEL
jgi:hypothetical protein